MMAYHSPKSRAYDDFEESNGHFGSESFLDWLDSVDGFFQHSKLSEE